MSYRAMMYDEGVFASRPAASIGNGYVYFATDTGNLYRSNGSAWTLIGSTGGGSVTFGTPAIALGTSAGAGSIDEAIRRDATIVAFDATNPTTQAFGDAAAVGTAGVAARRDHKHAMMAAPTTVSGNAGTATALQTGRAIDGVTFDGTADITVIAPGTHAATSKVTPVDNDEIPLVDSAASNGLKKVLWSNVKATLKAYFDTLYAASGGSGIGAVLFDSTLGADTASIDTGAAGIAGGYRWIECVIIARTADAGAAVNIIVTVNNDTSSIYDLQFIQGNSTTASADGAAAAARWPITLHGSGGSTGYPGVARIIIPGYDQTTFWKTGVLTSGSPDATAGNRVAWSGVVGYRATTAISRMKVATQSGADLKAGSRLTVIGW